MADTEKDITSEETEELDNTNSAPVSPRGHIDTKAAMADISDNEVIITGARQKENIDDQEAFNRYIDVPLRMMVP